jgi:nitrogen fixation protein FixH
LSTLAIVIVVVVVGLILLAVGGMVANARWRRRGEARFEVSLDEVNRQLAAAHAQDKGWEPRALEEAARRSFVEERPGAEVREQALVAVIDRPGTDEDKAVFRFTTPDGAAYLTLGRRGGEWVRERLE